MRICVQSNTDFTSSARWSSYLAAETAHLKAVARPDTEVELRGVETMSANVTRSAGARFTNTGRLIEACHRNQDDGFDAIANIGLAIMGKEELAESLSIPIVFAQDVAWTFATWRFGRFGLLSHDPAVYFRRVDQIRASRIEGSFVPGDYADLVVDDVLTGFEDVDAILPQLSAAAERAVRDGARVLVPDVGPVNAVLVQHGIRTVCGVPVLDTSGLTLHATELLVDATRSGVLPH